MKLISGKDELNGILIILYKFLKRERLDFRRFRNSVKQHSVLKVISLLPSKDDKPRVLKLV